MVVRASSWNFSILDNARPYSSINGLGRMQVIINLTKVGEERLVPAAVGVPEVSPKCTVVTDVRTAGSSHRHGYRWTASPLRSQ